MKKKLPQTLVLTGIPHTVRVGTLNRFMVDQGFISSSDNDKQVIEIVDDVPYSRKVSYLIVEVAHALLSAAGLSPKKTDGLREPFGRSLYQIIKDNDFTWVRADDQDPPTSVVIGGMRYTVNSNADQHLDDLGLSGEIDFRKLTIALHSEVAPESRKMVLLHECVHGMLYECGSASYNDETLVQPVGHFLYLLFKQNDFSFAYADQGATLPDM